MENIGQMKLKNDLRKPLFLSTVWVHVCFTILNHLIESLEVKLLGLHVFISMPDSLSFN